MNIKIAYDEWQRALRLAVMHGDLATLVARIEGDAIASSERRAGVYIDAYRLRLIEVLGNDYPVLKASLGDDAFTRLADGYIAEHPSSTPSVRWFGRHLASWLGEVGAPLVQVELAAFEWAQGEVFDGLGADVAVLDDMAGLKPEAWSALSLKLHPAARLLPLCGNAAAQVRAHGAGEAIPAFVDQGAERSWLLWRRGFDVHWRALEVDEADALAALIHGISFGELCMRLATWTPEADVAMRAASLLKRWLCDELIVRFAEN